MNFLVNSSRGTMFMKSIDASSIVKTGEKLFELLTIGWRKLVKPMLLK